MNKKITVFFLICALLIPMLSAITVSAGAESADIFTESFDQETDITVTNDARSTPNGKIWKLYMWYNADGTPKKTDDDSIRMQEGDYATYHPKLIENGIIAEGDDYETVLEKYAEYLSQAARLVYRGNWTMGSYQADGSYAASEQRVFFYSQYWYGVRITSKEYRIPTANWQPEFATSVANASKYLASFMEIGETALQPDENGRIYWADMQDVYADKSTVTNTLVSDTYVWDKDAGSVSFQKNKADSDVKLIALRPTSVKQKAYGAYNYEVPEGVVGRATLSVLGFTDYQNNPAKMAVALNGEVIWPAGASITDASSWWSYAGDGKVDGLKTGLADLHVDLQAGDNLAILVARDPAGDNGPIIDVQPQISIERKYVVEYKDAEGETLTTHIVAKNAEMPKAPFAASADGWIINGEAAVELPETVTDNLVIEYAGEATIESVAVSAVSISVSSDFSINVYLTADEYAQRAGLSDDDGNEYWGVPQADGTYKVTMPGFIAKDMDRELNLWLFQEFDGAHPHDSDDPYLLVPTEVLAAYADSDATDAEKAVAAAALDYAKAAKAYFYGEALDADVKARLAEQDAAIAALESNVEMKDGGEYFVNGMTLVLRDQVAFKIRVASSMYDPMGGETLDFIVAVEGNGTETEYTGFVYTEGSEEYDITMSLGAVSAADFDTTFKFTVKDAAFPVAETFSYSVNDYIARTFDAASEQADLVRAIYALGVAANNA